MKKLSILILMIGIIGTTHAQLLKFGLRFGASSTQVKLSDAIQVRRAIQGGDTTYVLNFANNTPMGFHFGGFAQIGIAGIFIQPEILFATTGGEVEIIDAGTNIERSAKQRDFRIDVPVLVGWKFGPARLGTGPVASFNLFTKDEVADIVGELSSDGGSSPTAETMFKKAVWGWQLGAGVNILGKIAIDAKYEFGLSKLGDGLSIDGQKYNFSKRANQAILSIGYMF